MHDLVVCAVFKNEAHILDEWIRHYLVRGVDHIYLVNDASSDNYLDIVTSFGDKITLFTNEVVSHDIGRQLQICERYFKPIMSTTKWAAILDLDEFLYSPKSIDLTEIMRSYEDKSQVTVDWLHFGSSGHVYQPHSVTESFTSRSIIDRSKPFYAYKSIVKGSEFVSFNVHSHVVNGPSHHILYDEAVEPDLVVNHYTIQSLEFFMKVKATRGDINNAFINGMARNKAYFDSYDVNNITDTRLREQNEMINNDVKRGKIGSTDEITLVITSCNRASLLEKTLQSFTLQNTYPIKETIIIDDSGRIGCNDEVVARFPHLHIKSIYNSRNLGQVESIERAYSYVHTKWIFHCEEDWEFTKPGFIEKSKQVFDQNPDDKIYTVWLRAHDNCSGHPVTYDSLNRGYYEMKRDFSYVDDAGKLHVWGGITFNPGLRRTDVCYLFHPYTDKCGKIQHKDREYCGEYPINTSYRELGYYSMILGDPSGHVRHIGADFHIPRVWDTNAPEVQPSHANTQSIINPPTYPQQPRKKYIWNVRVDRNH